VQVIIPPGGGLIPQVPQGGGAQGGQGAGGEGGRGGAGGAGQKNVSANCSQQLFEVIQESSQIDLCENL